jgi:hypothetical protein
MKSPAPTDCRHWARPDAFSKGDLVVGLDGVVVGLRSLFCLVLRGFLWRLSLERGVQVRMLRRLAVPAGVGVPKIEFGNAGNPPAIAGHLDGVVTVATARDLLLFHVASQRSNGS